MLELYPRTPWALRKPWQCSDGEWGCSCSIAARPDPSAAAREREQDQVDAVWEETDGRVGCVEEGMDGLEDVASLSSNHLPNVQSVINDTSQSITPRVSPDTLNTAQSRSAGESAPHLVNGANIPTSNLHTPSPISNTND